MFSEKEKYLAFYFRGHENYGIISLDTINAMLPGESCFCLIAKPGSSFVEWANDDIVFSLFYVANFKRFKLIKPRVLKNMIFTTDANL
jgi:hypothetical protein